MVKCVAVDVLDSLCDEETGNNKFSSLYAREETAPPLLRWWSQRVLHPYCQEFPLEMNGES